MSIRPVSKIIKAKATLEGAGVHLRRAFGFHNTSDFDPFLLLDDFRNDIPEDYLAGFPWHPHRGIETITYVLAGTVEHGDSIGNHGAIGAGDIQWMTAGRGIIHQEMPKGDAEGRMHGFQLWANLPASLKMTAPRYQEVKAAEIPEITDDDGTRARVVCGEFWGKRGPVDRHRRRPHLHRCFRWPQQTKSPARRNHPPRIRLRLCRLRKILQRLRPARRPHRNPQLVRPQTAHRSRRPLARPLRSRRSGRSPSGRKRNPVSVGVRQTPRRTGRLVRPHRHEHARSIKRSVRRTRKRNVPEEMNYQNSG